MFFLLLVCISYDHSKNKNKILRDQGDGVLLDDGDIENDCNSSLIKSIRLGEDDEEGLGVDDDMLWMDNEDRLGVDDEDRLGVDDDILWMDIEDRLGVDEDEDKD